MADGIFVIRGDLDSGNAELFEMKQAAYDTEDVLQTLLERYPDLLAGGQMNPESPRRWLLLQREQPVPDVLDGYARWSLDHLFVDQDGVPTLVEVKRSTDTRIRREVVGQMLDYAANAVAYWPVERLRADFESRNMDAVAAIANALGADVDVETLWVNVRTNLETGKIRLIFLADEIPRELRRIVEFLNKQMTAEVLAVEVGQYVAAGATDLRTLVARVHGLTAALPPAPPPRDWSEATFFEALATRAPEAMESARAVLGWALRRGLTVRWGKGATTGSFLVFPPDGSRYLLAVRTDGRVEIAAGYLARYAAFEQEDARKELAERLRSVPVEISDDQINRYPTFPLSRLGPDGGLGRFIDVMEWVFSQLVPLGPK